MESNDLNWWGEVLSFMKSANDYGLWDSIATAVLLASFLIGVKLVFFPKKRIPHLNIHFEKVRDTTNYPLKICVQIRNYTGRSCVIAFPLVELNGLRADPKARANSSTGEYELKFSWGGSYLTEIEVFLKHRESTDTWIPIDPTHTDEEVDVALSKGKVGRIKCTCLWVLEEPKHDKLRIPIRRT